MTHPLLNRIFMLNHRADERFLDHQRRSTSTAAMVGVIAAFAQLEYRLLAQHFVSWDLIRVIYAVAATKIALMVWYRFKN